MNNINPLPNSIGYTLLGVCIGVGTIYFIDPECTNRAVDRVIQGIRPFATPARVAGIYFTCVGIHATASMIIPPAIDYFRGER